METHTRRVRSNMARSVAVATEGPASKAVIEAIIRRLGLTPRVLNAEGKPKLLQTFDKLLRTIDLRFSPDVFLVVPDLHPAVDCRTDVEMWNIEIQARFPKAQLCTAIWETESWLLGDPMTLEGIIGIHFKVANPDHIGGDRPSRLIQDLYRRQKGYTRGAAFDKSVDGARLASAMDLRIAAKKSKSLARFIERAEGRR